MHAAGVAAIALLVLAITIMSVFSIVAYGIMPSDSMSSAGKFALIGFLVLAIVGVMSGVAIGVVRRVDAADRKSAYEPLTA